MPTLDWLNRANTPRAVYGESVRVGPARLAAVGVTFKQIRYDVRAGRNHGAIDIDPKSVPVCVSRA